MRKAAFILLFCCVFWGYSFPVMKLAMESLHGKYWGHAGAPVGDGQRLEIQEIGLSAAFLGWRFVLAAVFTAACFPAVRRGFTRAEFTGGAWMGVIFGAGMILQLAGLRYTLPSVSSFLTSLTVIFTPLAQAVIFRRRVSGATWLGVALAAAGSTILSLPNEGACPECHPQPVPPIPYLGEALTTLGAVFFSAQILMLDRIGARCHPMRVTLAMFGGAALLQSLIGAAFCGGALYRADVLGPLWTDSQFVFLLLSLTLLSSVLAIHLMNHYQKFVAPAVASVIYSMESVFAVIFSLAFGRENLTAKTLLGGALILCALVLVTMPSKAPVVAPEA